VAFDEDTPHRLVHAIRPHVFVKGGDYTRERLPEAALVEELGGRVEILPLVRERSTTKIISRIRAAEGPTERKPVTPSAGLPGSSFSARLS
jgi:D-beta-D-heptose 7-phosphate kinase/D-beta-D-heptose 1-phosphate adenosyltransferase